MTVALFVLFALFLILGVPIAFSLGLSSLGALLIGDGSFSGCCLKTLFCCRLLFPNGNPIFRSCRMHYGKGKVIS